ncbi:MAG: hypothetical protein KC442_01340, partial [Thermomicrobiales bacterium]|nr:hypothetical protein [Thermomicrobiales bacterium]
HAQVIAQGVGALPAEAAWRVVFHSVSPGESVTLPDDGPGFLLVDTGGVVAGVAGQETLLAPAEALFAGSGNTLVTSLGDRAAGVFAIRAVDAGQAGDAGSGISVFAGDPFPAPAGARDFDLVRDRLEPGESTTVIGAQAPVLVLVTLGAVSAQDANGASVDLQVGEAATLEGDVVITAAGQAPATFVAAVVGREVGAVTAATPGASPQASGAGTVQLAVHACPADLRPRDASPDTCPLDPAAALFELVAQPSGESVGPSRERDGLPTWSGLASGDYVLRAEAYGDGFGRFAVRGLQPAEDTDGVVVRVTSELAEQRLDIFVLAETRAPAGAATPSPVPGDDARPAATVPATAAPESTEVPSVISIETPEAGGEDTPKPPATAPAGPTEIPSVITIETPVPGAEPTATPRPDPIARSTASPTPRPLVTSTAVAQPRTGTVEVRIFGCNAGFEAFNPANCAQAVDGFAVQLVNADGEVFGMDQAEIEADGSVSWKGLPLADYLLQVPVMLPGAATYYAPNLQLADNGAGYIVSIGRQEPVATVDVFNLPPAPTPIPTIAPTVAVAADSDGDGLLDGDEAVYGTDPNLADSDGDGVLDGAEVAAGTNPLAADAAPAAEVDSDGDGILDADEAVFGTDPNVADSDGDGWLDGDEV